MNHYINAFIESINIDNMSENTIMAYQKDIEQLFSELQNKTIEKVVKEDIINYINTLQQYSYKETTIARKISSIKQFFNFLYSEDYIKTNPAINVEFSYKKIEIPKFIDIELMNKIFTFLYQEESYKAIRLATIVEMLYSTGIRVSEMVSLKRSQIQFINNEIVNHIIVTGKGNKERIVPLNNSVIKILYKYISYLDNDSYYLFPAGGVDNKKTKKSKTGHITRQYVGQQLKIIASKLNINSDLISPHIIRHSFATHLLNNGVDLIIVKELLGHSSINTTQIYTHIISQELINTINKNHPIANNAISIK